MAVVVNESEIAAPPEAVTDHVTDLSRWPSFRGAGPIPGIVRAEADRPFGVGARVRVTNTDGSVHTEVVEELERGRRLRIRMEMAPPASYVLARIEETLDLRPAGPGTHLVRRFDLVPRSFLTAPLAWVLAMFMRRAVRAHDAEVAEALAKSVHDLA